ncbi:MAG: cysteine synthase A [Bacillota bacterium]
MSIGCKAAHSRVCKKICTNILEAVGNTPIVELQRMREPNAARVLVKVEFLNVGGSIKTRTALAMIEAAEKEGILKEDSIIVEPSSGNQGIGLALVGAIKNYRVVIVMPDSVSEERRKLMEHYGAEVVLVPDKGDIGECIEGCLDTAVQMAEKDPRVFIPQQFTNPNNPKVQRLHTAVEILEQVDTPIDGFCSGIGTGGTLSGVGEVLKANFPHVRIMAVEPENAAILAGGGISTHLQMGIGDGLIPDNLNTDIIDGVYVISDNEALQTARDLARYEGLLAGISSGSNVAGALRLARELGPGKTVLTFLPDTGERYFSTQLFEQK